MNRTAQPPRVTGDRVAAHSLAGQSSTSSNDGRRKSAHLKRSHGERLPPAQVCDRQGQGAATTRPFSSTITRSASWSTSPRSWLT
jgi:hypothetical protein